MTIRYHIRKWITNKTNPRCQSLFPHALFINLNTLMASRSICMPFLCIYQYRLLIHNPEFEETRVRAFGDADQTSTYPSKGSSGPSTAQSHDTSITLIAETRCAPLGRSYACITSQSYSTLSVKTSAPYPPSPSSSVIGLIILLLKYTLTPICKSSTAAGSKQTLPPNHTISFPYIIRIFLLPT